MREFLRKTIKSLKISDLLWSIGESNSCHLKLNKTPSIEGLMLS